MFKSKWQRKYEAVMEEVEFWIDYHNDQAKILKACNDKEDRSLSETHVAQAIALRDTLNTMKKIAKR